MDLQSYATSFHGVVSNHFNAKLTIIECEEIAAFKLEYLDSITTPSINFEKQSVESLRKCLSAFTSEAQLEKIFLSIEANPLLYEELGLILSFPYMWGIKLKDPLLWDAEAGCGDAKFILNKTGRKC